MSPNIPTARTGELLAGKYRLLERLGMGGMGDVYRATHEAIGRTVAIKLLRPELASTVETNERLTREARAANLVRHPNVVDVLDFGTDDKLGVYLVQELLEGEDLSAYLARHDGRLAIDEALSICLPVIGAVATAHAAGVIHRDLKPGNVFLNHAPDGKWIPKVLDFGISKITGPTGRIDVSTMSVTLGTPAYMSPEQIQGDPIDARSDVWSLGVILHQVLAGDLPFRGESVGKQYVQICTAAPAALEEVAPGTPPEIIAIVRRCLEKSPEARYATAAELLAAFEGLPVAAEARARTLLIQPPPGQLVAPSEPTGQSLSPVARSRTVTRSPRRIAGAVAIALVAAVGLAVFARTQTAHPPERHAAAPTSASNTMPPGPVSPTPPPVVPTIALPVAATNPPAPENGTGATTQVTAPVPAQGAADGGAPHRGSVNGSGTRPPGRTRPGGNPWGVLTHY